MNQTRAMNLYLDVGNSRIKWRHDTMVETQAVSSLEALQLQWQALARSGDIKLAGSNVRGDAISRQIDRLAWQCFGVNVSWLSSGAEACGVRSAYADPASLGVDRWAALVAARNRVADDACIVIDAGSAITVDAIDRTGQHRGGVIMPGVGMMFDGLGRAEQLQAISGEARRLLVENRQALAQSTQDAIISGVVFSIRGGVKSVIEQQCEQIKAKLRSIPIFVTGGDANMFKFDALQMQWLPDLVLEGVCLLSRYDQ